ncbi:Abi-alpha family protein [Stenotrophomonas maltophilia]|uniref:Abi-alpha family protein n=1 Tax=Stenotrophomonas maltophilia TaxID=40324 RepID=UPI003CCFF1AD
MTNQPLINIKLVVDEQGGFHITHRHISLLAFKAGCERSLLAANYLDNLARLGLIAIPDHYFTMKRRTRRSRTSHRSKDSGGSWKERRMPG